MKYDRPVWQLMYECAATMPAVFRYEDVQAFFADRYPEVGQATIRAHLIGMSEGGRPKPVQFAARAPIFRRVTRGAYEVIPLAERVRDAELPPGESPLERAEAGRAARRSVRVPESAGEGDDDPDPADQDPAPPTQPDGDRSADPPGTDDSAPVAPAVVAARPLARTDDFEELIARAGLADSSTTEHAPGAGAQADDAEILLLGAGGPRVAVPAPAREMSRDERFQMARVRAQQRGARWFVLSSEHGLLRPQEWLSPEQRDLGDHDAAHRAAWAGWVVARLQSLVGPLPERRVHLDAPTDQLAPLVSALLDAGAVVTVAGRPGPVVDPGPGLGAGHGVMARTAEPAVPVLRDPAAADRAASSPTEPVHHRSAVTRRLAAAEAEVERAVAALADPDRTVAADALDALHDVAGLFAWHVDTDGARLLNRSLMLPVGRGVLHVGHAGAGGVAPDPARTVRHLVQDVQLAGRSRGSTFRASLATILREPLGLSTLDDPVLTAWMREHLRITTWAVLEASSLAALWHRVVQRLEPPLNIDHLRAAEMRRRLGQLRAAVQ